METLVIPVLSSLWWTQIMVNFFLVIGLLLFGVTLPKRQQMVYARLVGFVIFFQIYATQFYFESQGFWSKEALPFEFCSIMAAIGGIALYTRNQWFYEISLFLGIVPPTMAFIFPCIYGGKDEVITLLYFFSHCLTIFAPLYCTFNLGMRPRVFGWYRALGNFIIILPIMMMTNYVLKTNYMYLFDPPMVAEKLVFGQWPYYIFFWIIMIGSVSYLISSCMKKHPL